MAKDSPKNTSAGQAQGSDLKNGKAPVKPTTLPFTLNELRNAIPERCFKKSLPLSLAYLLRDVAILFVLYTFLRPEISSSIFCWLLWWNVTGFYFWCMFVEGHDCGHGSFSNYTYINDFIGHLCHAPLCVPFHGWRISHRAHHQHHNDIEHDHSWVPIQRSDFKSIPNFPNKFARFSPILLILYPVYLLQESNTGGFSGNHFNPFSPMFQKSERLGAAISSMTVIVFLGTLLKNLLLTDFLYYYAGPYVIFIIWLALVTYLQHTDEKGLYFKGASWDYLRAALSTFDRTYSHLIDPFNLGYGWILDHLHHNISDAHVVHHLFFTAIPHYRLKEATAAIIPILGKHYNFDPTPLPKAFWRSVTRCNFVPDDNEPSSQEGVYMYVTNEKSE